MTHPYLQPLRASEIIANSARLFLEHLRLLVLVSLGPHLALLGLELLLLPGEAPTPEMFALLMLATVIMNGIALAAITVAVGRCLTGEEPGVVETYSRALNTSLPAVVIAYLVTAVLVSVGMMMLVLPGVLMGALFATAVPVIVVERLGVVQGLGRSIALVKVDLIKGMVVFSYFILVAGFLPLMLLVLQGNAAMGPLSPLLSAIIGAVTLPLGFTANVLLYFSLRSADSAAAQQLEAQLKGPLAGGDSPE